MNNVRFLQEQRGMTQDEFAEYCDLPRISIARYAVVAAGGDIEENEFIRLLAVVGNGALHRVACIPQVDKMGTLHHATIGHIQTRYDSFC